MYTTTASIDGWVYNGYFQHLRNHVVEFAGTYYGCRLAWILPGALAYHLLKPEAANLALRLLLTLSSLIGGLFLLRRTYGIRCAVICAIALSADWYFHHATGWDYVDGAGVTYLMLTLEELCAAPAFGDRLMWLRSVLAGGLLAAAIHTNTLLIVFIPVFLIGLVLRTGLSDRFMKIVTGAFGGCVLSTSALGAISLWLGGPFLFMMPSIDFMIGVARHPNATRDPAGQWISVAGWIVVPITIAILAVVMGVVLLWRSRGHVWTDSYLRIRLADLSMILVACAIYLALHLRNSPAYQFEYTVSYLIPFSFVAAGALIGRSLDALPQRAYLFLAVGCSAVATLVGAELLRRAWIPILARPITVSVSIAVLAALCGSAIFVKSLNVRITVTTTAAALWFVHLGLTTASGQGSLARAQHLEVVQSSRDLTRFLGARHLFFWYGEVDPGYINLALTSTFLWGYRVVGTHMPSTAIVNFKVLSPEARLVLLGKTREDVDRGYEALTRAGLGLRFVSEVDERVVSRPLTMGIFDVVQSNVSETAFGGRIDREDGPTAWIQRWNEPDLPKQFEFHLDRLPDVATEDRGIYRALNRYEYVATHFVSFSSDFRNAVTINLRFPRAASANGGERFFIQDESYAVVYDSGIMTDESFRRTIIADHAIRAIRLLFIPNDDMMIVLPDQLGFGHPSPE